MSRVGLHFNGTDTYCQIPVSVASANSWEVTLSISTDQSNVSGSAIYNNPCIFGYDSANFASKDFHIDLCNGNLFVFTGLGNSNNRYQIVSGSLIYTNGDYGWNTDKYIADGDLHIIRAAYESSNRRISLYLDEEYLGYLNTNYKINSTNLYLGCSQIGEKKYSRFDLYDFNLKIDGANSVIYVPDDADLALNTLTDLSGNNNNGTLYGTVSSVGFKLVFSCDTERAFSSANLQLNFDCERRISSRVGLHFNGTNTYCEIPVSVKNAQRWEASLSVSTSQIKSGSKIYNQPCIFGFDSPGAGSKDLHIDLCNGNLFIFSGLGSSNSDLQLQYGTVVEDNTDFGWDTGKNIADGALHKIYVVFENNTIAVYLDGIYLGYLNTAYTIDSTALYLGCSQVGEKQYSEFDLYDFSLKIDSIDSVIYAPDEADLAINTLTDLSGNNNNGTLYGTVSSVTYLNSINYLVDIEREIKPEIAIVFDAERIIFVGASLDFFVDTERVLLTATINVNVFFDVERTIESSVSIVFDTIRMTNVPAFKWRYENVGIIDDLNSTSAVQLTGLPLTQSRTGFAFYQESYTNLFNLSSADEVWIKFDIYALITSRWMCCNRPTANSADTGVQGHPCNGEISFINLDHFVVDVEDVAEAEELQTFLVHMKADPVNGVIELFSSDGGLVYSYSGSVNGGSAFTALYLLSEYDWDTEPEGPSDTDHAYFSNIIVSNQPVWLDENAVFNFSVDTERRTCGNVIFSTDVERVLENSVTLNFDTERVLVIVFDTIRMTYVPASKWRYENIGKTNDLLDTSHAVQLSNLPATQSKTGYAFYQTDEQAGQILPAQSAGEVWIKFDIYRTPNGFFMFAARIPPNTMDYGVSSGNWYIEDEASDSEKRLLEAWGLFYEPETYYKWTEVKTLRENSAKVNEIQTVIVHMKASSKPRNVNDGFYEIFTEDGGLLLAKDDYHTDESAFTAYHMCGGSNGEAYVSNIIISNQPLWFDDNALVSEPVSIVFDVNRQVGISVSLTNDVERELLTDSHSEYLSFDTAREIVLMPTLDIDTLRDLSATLSIDIDLERMLIGSSVSIDFDLVRQVGTTYALTNDAERILVIGAEVLFDVEKSIYRTEEFLVDLKRQIPYQLVVDAVDPTEEPTVIPIAQNDAGLQSISIQITEQQVTDQVAFVHAGNCNILDKIQGTYRDYVFDLRVEETTTQGIIQEVSCCSDIDELLYSQIAYEIPEDKYEWDDDYLARLGRVQQESPEEEIEAQPSTTIEEHLRTIAQVMGKSLVYRGAKFYSTANVKEQGGKTYASVISELIGWSSRLPHLAINAYFRGGVLYVIQRGHESNVMPLDEAKIANVRINKKLIRTTWGSDVWSKSTVDTYINDWQELEQEPYTPPAEGSSATYDDDNLVESTTTESSEEKTETHYYYDEGPNGEKYLAREETIKYEISENGAWKEYDRITTTHERISSTQSHIYAESEDGSIYGEVVSPNKFDDRSTPYDRSHGGNDRGYLLMHDSQGNQYKCYSIAYYSKQMEKGTRTTYGLSLIDTSFPLYGEDALTYLTQQLMWLNRKTEETVTLDVYDVNHVIGFDDRISLNGAVYFLKSNSVLQNESIVNKQSLTLVRWY